MLCTASLQATSHEKPVKAFAVAEFGKLPLAFEQNQGQTNSDVDYFARGRSYAMFLTRGGATMTLTKPGSDRSDVLRMNLAGANAVSVVTPESQLPGKVNYLTGDSSQWKTGIAQFARVRYQGVYPGVDLVYYGSQGQLEYDFVVQPGASADRVAFQMEGTTGIRVAADGELRLQLANGEVRWKRPEAYQVINGRRRAVAAEYAVVGNAVAFRLGEYDHSHPLVIDPMLVFGTYLGGADTSMGDAIAVDSAHNVYIAGVANSSQYPVTENAYDKVHKGNQDAFLTKLSADGKSLIYSTYLGGSDNDSANTLAVDSAGEVYVGGGTLSSDFPVTSGAYHLNGGVNGTGFITKLNSTGSGLIYSAEIGAATVRSIAIDSQGNAYVTGGVFGTFHTTAGAYKTQITNTNCPNVSGESYVFKMNPSGSAPVYSTYISDCEQAYGIALLNGNAYITGQTDHFHPVTTGAFQPNFGGYIDAFITELNTAGSALVYSTYMGGSLGDYGNGIVVDASGNATIAGYTGSSNYPVANAFQSKPPNTNTSATVTKINATGTALVYSTYLGGSNDDFANGIAQDSSGNVYVTGQASSADFPTRNAFQGICGVSNFTTCYPSAFVSEFNSGGGFVASTYYGPPTSWADGMAIAADSLGNAYITGYAGLNLPTLNAYESTTNGDSGTVFAAKVNMNGQTGCTNLRQNRTVAICNPFTNTTSGPFVRVSAVVNDTNPVSAIQVYVDGVIALEEVTPTQIDSYVQVAPGTHTITVKAWDKQGSFLSSRTVTVTGSNSAACTVGEILPYVQICTPLGSSTASNPVHVHAIAASQNQPVTSMALYVDGVLKDSVSGNTLDTSVTLATGFRKITVNAWDWRGQVFKQTVWVTVK